MLTQIDLLARTTPVTPDEGETRVFVDSSTKKLQTVDDAGTVSEYASLADATSAATTAAQEAIAVETINAQTGTTYTLVLTDAGKLITCTNGSAVTVTVPLNADVAFAVGTRIDIVQGGAGAVTIAGGGVTFHSLDGNLTTNGQYVAISLVKTATNTWLVIGNLTT